MGVGALGDGQKIIDKGGKVAEILTGSPRTDLESWITTYNLNVSSFIDSPSTPNGALTAATIRETVWIVQMPSMKIVYVNHGDTSGLKASSIGAATAQILSLLM